MLLHEVLGSRAGIELDGRRLEVSIDELKQHWFGEYRLLWKTPPSGTASLRPGDRGDDVRWLRKQLHSATGLTAIAPDPTYFDAGLKELVQTFQRSQELDADGVAGARTLINLNNLDRQPSVPRLGSSDASS